MKTNYKDVVSQKYIKLDETKLGEYKNILESEGILVLEDFVNEESLGTLKREALELYSQAYRSSASYNLFVEEEGNVASEGLKKRSFVTEKGCICYDEISEESLLKLLYKNTKFQNMMKQIVGSRELYPYADNLSSININYYEKGDSLEWHYDNSTFTVTLLIKEADEGGIFEYFTDIRYDEKGKQDYVSIEKMVDGSWNPRKLKQKEATLVVFKGTQSLHRVTPIIKGQRILVVFCYLPKPGISLSKTSRKTFFGRVC